MILYLMRHGAAEDHAKSGRDRDRKLSAKGRAAATAAAVELLRQRGEPIRVIVTSPATRALETAELVQRHAGDKQTTLETRDELAPEQATPLSLARSLAARGHDVLIVGHQPWIEALARALAQRGPAIPNYSTSLIVGIDPHTERVVALIDPRAAAS
jgi:phosphohistidine phosphatase